MKKTLLSLALAGLAASAFANVSFYKSDVANLYTSGSLSLNYHSGSAKADEHATGEANKVVKFSEKAKESKLGFDLVTGGDFMVKDGLSAGYYVKYSGPKSLLDKNKENDGAYVKADKKPYTFKLNKAYVYLGYPTFGKVTLGKNIATVTDSALGTDLDTIDISNAFGMEGNDGIPTSFNSVVYYTSPNFGGFHFNYSFGNSHEDNYARQNSFNGVYDFGGTKVSALASFTNNYNTWGDLYYKSNGYEVAVENTDLMENLTLKAAYQSASTTMYQTEAPFAHLYKSSTKGLVLTAAYEMNQYFKPYTGFVFTNTTVENSPYHGKMYNLYLGTSAELYKDEYVNVSAFVEGAIEKYKGKIKNEDTSRVRVKATSKEYALGVKVAF